MCTQIFTLPLGTIQKVLQTTGKEDPNHSNASMIISNISEKHGVRALWSGMEMSMLLTINPAINMYIYERIRMSIRKTLGSQSALIDFISGLCSKAIATIVCYPLIYIKVKRQAEKQKDTVSSSVVQFIKNTYNEHGITGFYSGLSSKLLQSSLSNAIMLTVKEKVANYAFPVLVYLVEIKRKQI
eukprot:944362_1